MLGCSVGETGALVAASRMFHAYVRTPVPRPRPCGLPFAFAFAGHPLFSHQCPRTNAQGRGRHQRRRPAGHHVFVASQAARVSTCGSVWRAWLFPLLLFSFSSFGPLPFLPCLSRHCSTRLTPPFPLPPSRHAHTASSPRSTRRTCPRPLATCRWPPSPSSPP